MKIVAHMMVKNEENFVWFAVNSVLFYVDKILIWDTGSTDKTQEILRSIDSDKISFRELGELNAPELASARQKMIDESKGFDWIFIIDGDEVWHESVLKELTGVISIISQDVVAVPNIMLIGDVFHHQEEEAGKYEIAGRVGNMNIRMIRNLPGLHVAGDYPNEAFVTKQGVKVQNLGKDKVYFFDKPYLHASFLARSSTSSKKLKYENGIALAKDYYYPEVFFKDRSDIVQSPWRANSFFYWLNAFWQTPLKRLRRRII